MQEKIKIFLEKETGHKVPGDGANLIALGILDSFSMIKLIDFLEKEFEVKFDMEELSPENFNSINSMIQFIKETKKNGNKEN